MKGKIIAAIAMLTGIITGVAGSIYMGKKSEYKVKMDKFKDYYNLTIQWIDVKQRGKSLDEYFIKNQIKTIAIYGMGQVGEKFYNELKDTEIEVKYVIDQNAEGMVMEDCRMYTLEDELEKVDAVIVTATFVLKNVRHKLEKKIQARVISLEDIVYEV